MTTHVSGGGGSGYPGVTSDGNKGLIIENSLTVGSATDPVNESHSVFNGTTEFIESIASQANSDPVVSITQARPVLPGTGGGETLLIRRFGNISQQDYVNPTTHIVDFTASTQLLFELTKGINELLNIQSKVTVTGHLSAVTDASAKAVLTSLLALLTNIQIATDSTT